METVRSDQKRPRWYFLDNLRASIVFLVVIFHGAMAYMVHSPAWWYVDDPQRHLFFDLFVLICDVFMMPVLFFIAGYFVPQSLVSRGIKTFLKQKFWRLGIPWIGGVIFVAPVIAYMTLWTRGKGIGYLNFWQTLFWGPYYQQAHYWFLGLLLVFFLCTAVAKEFIVATQRKYARPPVWFFITFGLTGMMAFWAVNSMINDYAWINVRYILVLQPTRVPFYILYFLLGLYAWRTGWFEENGYRPEWRRWGWAAMIFGLGFVACKIAVPGGDNVWYRGINGLVHSFFCLGMTGFLLGLFQCWFNRGTLGWRRLAEHSYTVYFIHQLVILPLGYLASEWTLPLPAKYFLVAGTALVLCQWIAENIDRLLAQIRW